MVERREDGVFITAFYCGNEEAIDGFAIFDPENEARALDINVSLDESKDGVRVLPQDPAWVGSVAAGELLSRDRDVTAYGWTEDNSRALRALSFDMADLDGIPLGYSLFQDGASGELVAIKEGDSISPCSS